MSVQEVGIKFHLHYMQSAPLPASALRELNAWRRMLHLTGLIGGDPARYDGYAYGNISRRLLPSDGPHDVGAAARPFVISGSQTGGLPELTEMHYSVVTACHPEQNEVSAAGPIWPSSESLTHGTIYRLDDAVQCVMHGHAPEIWRHARALDLPVTHEAVPYGSPEMAEEVARLFRETDVGAQRVFSMGGHEDGVVAFGRTLEAAGAALLTTLARAFAHA